MDSVRGSLAITASCRSKRSIRPPWISKAQTAVGIAHSAIWNAEQSRIEMHLESLKDQRVRVAGQVFAFAGGETIHTENSAKFTVERFAALAQKAGWTLEASWLSEEPAFAVVSLMA